MDRRVCYLLQPVPQSVSPHLSELGSGPKESGSRTTLPRNSFFIPLHTLLYSLHSLLYPFMHLHTSFHVLSHSRTPPPLIIFFGILSNLLTLYPTPSNAPSHTPSNTSQHTRNAVLGIYVPNALAPVPTRVSNRLIKKRNQITTTDYCSVAMFSR